MSKEAYKFESNKLNSPALNAVDLDSEKSDTVDLTEPTRSVYIGVSGSIVVDMVGTGTSVTFSNIPAGTVLPIRIKRLRVTGTTATAVIGLY